MSKWDEEDARTVGGTGNDDMADRYEGVEGLRGWC